MEIGQGGAGSGKKMERTLILEFSVIQFLIVARLSQAQAVVFRMQIG